MAVLLKLKLPTWPDRTEVSYTLGFPSSDDPLLMVALFAAFLSVVWMVGVALLTVNGSQLPVAPV